MEKNYFIHSTSIVDDNVAIGDDTKIWHFSHIQSGARIGSNCSFCQNVNISNNNVTIVLRQFIGTDATAVHIFAYDKPDEGELISKLMKYIDYDTVIAKATASSSRLEFLPM